MGQDDKVVDITAQIKLNAQRQSPPNDKSEPCKFSYIDKGHVFTQREITLLFESVYDYAKEYVARMKEQGVLDEDAKAFIG